jgi:hypothetical protein
MTPEPASQHERPSYPAPPYPGPEWAGDCVLRNTSENCAIAYGLPFFRRPRRVPGAYWYWLQHWTPWPVLWFRLWALAFVICQGFMLANATLLFLGSDVLDRYGWLFWSYVILFWFQPVIVGRRAKLAFARTILEHEGMVCFNCGYYLDTLPDKHICPECGAAYDKPALQARWLEWMRAKEPYKR